MAAIFGFIGQDGTKYTNSHSLNLSCQSYYNLTYYLSLHPRGPGDVRRCSHPSHNGVVNTEQSVCYLYNMLRYRVVLFFIFFKMAMAANLDLEVKMVSNTKTYPFH